MLGRRGEGGAAAGLRLRHIVGSESDLLEADTMADLKIKLCTFCCDFQGIRCNNVFISLSAVCLTASSVWVWVAAGVGCKYFIISWIAPTIKKPEARVAHFSSTHCSLHERALMVCSDLRFVPET